MTDSNYIFRIVWSKDDQEYVGLCTEFPSLSYLHANQKCALQGIIDLVEAIAKDINAEMGYSHE